ncbi:MAG TPA: trehalose-phosphatase [Steroidobacteraceae bacterium]
MTNIPWIDKPALSGIALFLDVDGTLLEIAASPQAVSVPDDLRERLRALFLASSGAVALVSGRAIADLDALFAPLALPSAGLHGFEHRGTSGAYRRRPLPSAAALQAARSVMLDLASRHPGLFVEDKHFALALHYRGAPQLEDLAVTAARDTAAHASGELELQRGKMVVELRPAGATKAKAVAAFLEEAPFAGRRPIFIGDDLTDEPAFELVNRLGGWSAVVSATRPSAARVRLADVVAVRSWLAHLQAQPAAALQHLSDLESEPRASRLRSRA